MAAVPSRIENLQNLRLANLDSAFATAFATLVSGTFLVGFIRHLGGGDAWIGILAAVPSLCGILQIPGSIYGRRFLTYKHFVLPGGLTWRLFYLPLIVLAFVPWPNELRLFLLLICVAIASAATQFVNPIYTDWLAEMVPTNSRGWFFSRRNAIAAAIGSATGLVAGLVLDAFRRANMEAVGFGTLFIAAAIFSAVSFALYVRMTDRVRPNPIPATLREGLRAFKVPLMDRDFRPVLLFLAIFVLGQSFAGNLFAAFALESLDMSFTVLQISGVAHAAGMVTSGKVWGYLGDKYGNKPIIAILAVGIAFSPACWLFCVPGADFANAVILFVGHLFSGAMWGGIVVCQLNLLLATAKESDRANYIGIGLALQAVIGAVSPMLGAALMSQLRLTMDPITAYKWVFGVCMLMRGAAVAFLWPVKEEGSVSISGTLSDLKRVTPAGIMALKTLTHSGDVEERESAIAEVADRNYLLATDEVIKSLHDPSPRVRRRAATALAKLGRGDAARALIHQLEDHPDLVEEETVLALGEIADRDAVPYLVKLLDSPRTAIRRASARALGTIGDTSAVGALCAAASKSTDPDLRRSALQALRSIGDPQAEFVIADALFDPLPSVRIAAAEAVVDMDLRSCVGQLRESLERFSDDAASEVAYALGRLGATEDIPLILKQAANCVSMITRRRCLLGVAHMLDVEWETYRMMMLDGMARDAALIEATKPLRRVVPDLSDALSEFSAGNEPSAITRIVKRARKLPKVDWNNTEVEELFVVLALAAAKHA
ncbi:MAG: hypothetical protein HONBIEJF_02258 [Fimbriimonadaceae bacterium]|nr:hypothetical protein [Fimbriimonadaceae bacterium]